MDREKKNRNKMGNSWTCKVESFWKIKKETEEILINETFSKNREQIIDIRKGKNSVKKH